MFLKVLSRVSCWSVAHISWVISRLYSEVLQQTILVSMLDTPLCHNPGSDNITFIFIAWKKLLKLPPSIYIAHSVLSSAKHRSQHAYFECYSFGTVNYWMPFLCFPLQVISISSSFLFLLLPSPPSVFLPLTPSPLSFFFFVQILFCFEG